MKNESERLKLNEEKWDKWAKSLDGKNWKYEYLRKAQKSVIALLEVNENIHFLDVGCGTGWAVGEAAELTKGKGIFYGVDLSEKMIEKAKENFKGRDNFHFIKANVESIPLEDNFFDVIICTNSFHHYLNPDKALKEMQRLLRKNGKLYVLDPTADSLIIKAIDKIIKLLEAEHVKMYSTKEFKDLYKKAGFKYISPNIKGSHQKIHIGEKVL